MQRGDQVLWVPPWVSGDIHHKDCQRGVIVGLVGDVALVRYGKEGEGSPQRTRLAELRPAQFKRRERGNGRGRR